MKRTGTTAESPDPGGRTSKKLAALGSLIGFLTTSLRGGAFWNEVALKTKIFSRRRFLREFLYAT
jgi:hypothetical protein